MEMKISNSIVFRVRLIMTTHLIRYREHEHPNIWLRAQFVWWCYLGLLEPVSNIFDELLELDRIIKNENIGHVLIV
jgi:hypothetical protein